MFAGKSKKKWFPGSDNCIGGYAVGRACLHEYLRVRLLFKGGSPPQGQVETGVSGY